LWRIQTPPRPDPRLIGLAVRATLYALPTATPQRIIVTQIVVVTATPTSTPAPTFTPTPTFTAPPTRPSLPAAAPTSVAAQPASVETPVETTTVTPAGAAAEEQQVAVGEAISATKCPAVSAQQFAVIPVSGGGLAHPAELHADLNLAVRGYQPVAAANALFDFDGPVDSDPPQLAGVLAPGEAPHFGQTFQVYDWDWQCAPHGCRAQPLLEPEVSLIALAAAPDARVSIPLRHQPIYADGFKALVLYAEATRITLGYTREDGVTGGYVVHIENFCVDPALLALYTAHAAAGRTELPAVRDDESIGVAALGDILVAVRDRGAFLDPRSRRNWWQGQ